MIRMAGIILARVYTIRREIFEVNISQFVIEMFDVL